MIVLWSILLFISVLLIPVSIWYYMNNVNKSKNNVIVKEKVKPRSDKELTDILYGVIEREWTYRVKFHFKFKEIKAPKFETELEYLTSKVVRSLSPNILEEFYYYYTEEALARLIKNICQLLIYEYMQNLGLKMK